MNCPSCQTDNPTNNKFCGACGERLPVAAANAQLANEDGAYYCARHKKELTRVRCGRCEIPICTRCAVYGPAGVRCRDCARNRVPVRARGVLHEAGRTFEGAAQNPGRTIWFLAIWGFILSIFTGFFGGHNDS